MNTHTDTFIVGEKPAIKPKKAIKEERDSKGFLIKEGKDAIKASPAVEGIRVKINTPIPFEVILKSLESWDMDLIGSIKSGEVIVRSQVVSDAAWSKIEADGRLMMSLCAIVAGVYLTPEIVEQVKKN